MKREVLVGMILFASLIYICLRKLKPGLRMCINTNCSMFYSRDISASNSNHYIDLQIKKKK